MGVLGARLGAGGENASRTQTVPTIEHNDVVVIDTEALIGERGSLTAQADENHSVLLEGVDGCGGAALKDDAGAVGIGLALGEQRQARDVRCAQAIGVPLGDESCAIAPRSEHGLGLPIELCGGEAPADVALDFGQACSIGSPLLQRFVRRGCGPRGKGTGKGGPAPTRKIVCAREISIF